MGFTCMLVLFRFGIFVKRVPAHVEVSAGQLEIRPSEPAGPVGDGFVITPTQIRKVEFNLMNSMVTFLPERGSEMKKLALSLADVGFLAAAKQITVGGDGLAPGIDALKEWVVAHQLRSDEYRVSARGRTKVHRLV